MKEKIFSSLLIFILLTVGSRAKLNVAKVDAIIQEDPEFNKQKEKQESAMRDIVDLITIALADYASDHGTLPKQDGIYDEKSEFYKALCPRYIKKLPIKDPWGNNYLIYCGEAIKGKYGISEATEDDFMVVSYGRDGKKEVWKFDNPDPNLCFFDVKNIEDFNKDLVNWNGAWIRAPRLHDIY